MYMLNTKNKKGFTLIELLVVITIIGILATGATSVYTSQIQKARDATRVSDLNALKSWLEQVYQDKWAYPNSWIQSTNLTSFLETKIYTPKLPIDPKSWQRSSTSNFEYAYWVAADSNWIYWQIYEISWHFENTWNTKEKSWKDWWNNDIRLEQGISINTIWTQVFVTASIPSWVWTRSIPSVCIPRVTWSWTEAQSLAACLTASDSTTTSNPQTLIIK